MIKTKDVKDLTTKINVEVLAGMKLQPEKLPVLNATDSRRYLTEMAKSAGYSVSEIQNLPFVNTQKPVLENWGYSGNTEYYKYNQNTDWQDEIFQEAMKTQYSLGVSGGDEVALYGLSLGFLQKEGVRNGTDYNRLHPRINTGIKVTPKLEVV